jgi:hypothetical protein
VADGPAVTLDNVRLLEDLDASRGALLYSPLSGREPEEVFSDLMALPGTERGRGQQHGAPRGALPYSLLSREELGGMFLGLMPHLAPKG